VKKSEQIYVKHHKSCNSVVKHIVANFFQKSHLGYLYTSDLGIQIHRVNGPLQNYCSLS